MSKKFLNYIFYYFLLFIISLAFLEIFSRMLFPETMPKNKLYFNNMPNNLKIGPKNIKLNQVKNSGDYNVSVSFNKYGFRDYKDLKNSKPSDFFVVGDSMSFGWGVEENERYSDILENLSRINFYNLSIPGNLENYELLLEYAEENGAVIKNLIIGFTMENDFEIYQNKKEKLNYKKSESVKTKNYYISKIKRILTDNSSFYFIFTKAIHSNNHLKKIFINLGLINPNLEYIYYTKFSKKVITSTVNKLINISKNYKSIVVIIPSRALWVGPHREETNKIHNLFIEKLDENNVEYLDLRIAFENTENPIQKLHFKNDGHWNIYGHKIAAEEIFKKLK